MEEESGRLEAAVIAPNDLWTVDFKGWWIEPLTVRDAISPIADFRRSLMPRSAQMFYFLLHQVPKCFTHALAKVFAEYFRAILDAIFLSRTSTPVVFFMVGCLFFFRVIFIVNPDLASESNKHPPLFFNGIGIAANYAVHEPSDHFGKTAW